MLSWIKSLLPLSVHNLFTRSITVDHYGVTFSERGMRDVFYRLNLSYTRPTYVLAKADPQKQAEFLEKLEDIKKTPEW